VKFDKLALDFFDSSEDFSLAMKLLHKSTTALANSKSFDDYEKSFLDTDEIDDYLLSKAERFNQKLQDEFQTLQTEIQLLRAALKNGTRVEGTGDLDELLTKIQDSINPPLSNEDNPTLSELFELWKIAKKSSMVETSFNNAYRPAIELFIRIADDLEGEATRINKLKAEHIRGYQKLYQAIPKGTTASKYSISELRKLSGTFKSYKTIEDNYSNISTFLSWIGAKGYPIDSNLRHVLTKGSDTKANGDDSKERNPFTDQELHALFNSTAYTVTGKFLTSGMYWTALISLFTGARMSEILQLEKHDIANEDGVWYFNIDDRDHQSIDDMKHVKQDGSRRKVPIHKQLQKLGFLNYVGSRSDRLFPDEDRNIHGKFDKFQKRHSTYRHSVNVAPTHKLELKDFHSFRHTVRTQLTELRTTGNASQRFDEGIIDAIVGHASSARSVGQKTYNHSQYLKAKRKALDRLTYPSIDFDKIIPWDKCSFTRIANRKARIAKQKAIQKK